MEKKLARYVWVAMLVCVLGGCSYFKFPGVYKISIRQGNVIDQEMIDRLEKGMTQRQVRYVLGTPLVDDPFALNRWDYFYSYANPRGKAYQHQLTVFFEEGGLSGLEATDKFTLPESFGGVPKESTESAQ